MAELAFVAMAASALLQAKSTLAEGEAAQAAGKARQMALEHQAEQTRQTAGQERAASQRDASEQRRQARLLSSRALARAAGTGGPGVEKIIGDIDAEGEFRALNELFMGEERARGLETRADLLQFEGREERRAGDIRKRTSRTRALSQAVGGVAQGAAITRFGVKPGSTTLSGGTGLSRYG